MTLTAPKIIMQVHHRSFVLAAAGNLRAARDSLPVNRPGLRLRVSTGVTGSGRDKLAAAVAAAAAAWADRSRPSQW